MACSATVLMVLELEASNRGGFAHKLSVESLPNCVAGYIAAGLTPSDPGQDPRLSFVELATCAADHRAVLVAVAKYDEATRRVKDSTFKRAEKDADVAKQPTCVVWTEAFTAYRNAVSVLHPSLGLALGQHQLVREYAEAGIWLAFDVQQRTRASQEDVTEATLLLAGRSAADVSMLLSNQATKARMRMREMQPSTHRGQYPGTATATTRCTSTTTTTALSGEGRARRKWNRSTKPSHLASSSSVGAPAHRATSASSTTTTACRRAQLGTGSTTPGPNTNTAGSTPGQPHPRGTSKRRLSSEHNHPAGLSLVGSCCFSMDMT